MPLLFLFATNLPHGADNVSKSSGHLFRKMIEIAKKGMLFFHEYTCSNLTEGVALHEVLFSLPSESYVCAL